MLKKDVREVASFVDEQFEQMRSGLPVADQRRVYSRLPRPSESLPISQVLGASSVNVVEDGIGNYSHFDRKIRFVLRSYKIELFKGMSWLLWRLKGMEARLIQHKIPFRRLRVDQRYFVSKYPGAVQVGDAIKEPLKALWDGNADAGRRVVIIGSLLNESNSGFLPVNKQIQLYQRLIRHIKSRHDISGDDIWYKPHPRSPVAENEALAGHLDCRFYSPGEPLLMEMEFFNPGLEAVYSIGSTALVNARNIFGIPAYYILSDAVPLKTKGGFIKATVCEKFGLEPVRVDLG